MFSPFKLLKLMFGDLKFSTMKLKVSKPSLKFSFSAFCSLFLFSSTWFNKACFAGVNEEDSTLPYSYKNVAVLSFSF